MATFSDAPWSGDAGRWPTPEAYCSCCLVDENPAGKPKTKDACHLPYKEPGGAINKGALRSIWSTLNGGRGKIKFKRSPGLMDRVRRLCKQAGIDIGD
jgi:hypothetical protein